MSWDGVAAGKKDKMAKKLSQSGSPHVRIKTRFMFKMMGMIQKKGWNSSPIETQYWKEKGWLDVDTLDSFVGNMILMEPSVKKEMLRWSVSDNIWLRRVSIDCQQRFKEQTDQELLADVIRNNLGSNEFFINKAIGWSLREYSKVNPEWVREFIADNEQGLDKLSIREARKYI